MKNKEIKDRNWWRNWSENRMDIVKFKKESEKVCHYCNKQLTTKDEVTVDHVIPVSKGGENAKDNFVISCKACNREKSNLSAERYAEFLNIMNVMSEHGGTLDTIEKAVTGLKEIIINFNGELYALKNKLAAVKRKRTALLDSLMYRKFNVVQGYDYAKELRDMTEEIYNLKLNISQMNKIQENIKQISPFITGANAKALRNDAMREVRHEISSNYHAFTDEKPAAAENENAPAKSDAPASPEEQTG